MLIALSILVGVAFWVWVIDEVTSDDDDDKSTSSETETEDITEDIPEEDPAVDEGDNDLLIGTEGDDPLDGGEGLDIAFGLEGDDSLQGGADSDLLLGGQDDDLVEGGSGDDVLVGGEGADTLVGNSGNDLIDGTSLLDEDALLTSAQSADSFSDLSFSASAGPDTDEGDSIEGRGGDDWMILGSQDSASGGSGEDVFEGGHWITPGAPAVIEDYDAAEDAIVYSYDDDGAEPTITTNVDGVTGDATGFADGEEVLIVLAAGPTFNASNVTLVAV